MAGPSTMTSSLIIPISGKWFWKYVLMLMINCGYRNRACPRHFVRHWRSAAYLMFSLSGRVGARFQSVALTRVAPTRSWVGFNCLAVKSCLDMSADVLSGKVVSLMLELKPTPSELWLICPSRQSITPAVRLLRDTFREKSKAILTRLIEKGVLEGSVLD